MGTITETPALNAAGTLDGTELVEVYRNGVPLRTTVAGLDIPLKRGANGRVGTFVLNGATPVAVANTSIAATDAIIISLNTPGGTVGVQPHIVTLTPGVGFSVVGTASDTSTYNYAVLKNVA